MNQESEKALLEKDRQEKRSKQGFFETARLPTNCIVVVPILDVRRDDNPRLADARLEEAVGLAEAVKDLKVIHAEHFSLRQPKSATLIGAGKLEEIARASRKNRADLLIVDHSLTPIQQRNLERTLKLKVLDRTGLILEIFGERAQTKEGRLQVELAHLNYQKGRLVRSWTHLERQRGGFGFLGGPGETQIEADRRMLVQRIKYLESAIADVRRTRKLQRKNRKRKPHPVIALVGYTNAGKSTLFNRLTNSRVFAKDLLFATLDPTLRTVELPHGERVIISDTVGFISNLPTDLIAAFRATLEEVEQADLILHVRDISNEDSEAQSKDVLQILQDLGIDPTKDERLIEVWNKIDQLPEDDWRGDPLNYTELRTTSIPLSAVTGQGIDQLLRRIEASLNTTKQFADLKLPPERTGDMYWLYQNAEVLDRVDDAESGAISLRIRFDQKHSEEIVGKFRKFFA